MTNLVRTATLAIAVAAGAGWTLPAQADVPGEHPHYLHALHDLRAARAYLAHADEANVAADERRAIVELDQTIGEARRASVIDGKDLDDVPPIDARLRHRDRLQRALALERAAQRDLAYEEDDRAALGWRARAQADLRDAIAFTQRAIGTDFADDHPSMPGDHPHYLHALSDLRAARAYLYRADERNVMADQRAAIVEIDQAIGEASRAAIDDGKPLWDHPPVDAGLKRRDRLHRALALLGSARRDLGYEEDTQAALGWRARAQGDVNDAIAAVRRAIGDDRRDDQAAL